MNIIPVFGGGNVKSFPAGFYGLVDEALKEGHRVLPAVNGFQGIIDNDLIEITNSDQALDTHLLRLIDPKRSLVITGSPRIKLSDSDREKIKKNYQNKDVVIVVFGGDDNLGEAEKLMREGVNTEGWDKTMDRDKNVPLMCFGFDSFVEEAVKHTLGIRDMAYMNRTLGLATVFSRDADHVPSAVGYYGLSDLVLGGEMRKVLDKNEGSQRVLKLDHLKERIDSVLTGNERRYGVRFGTMLASEGAVYIEGYNEFVKAIAEATKDQRLPFKVDYDPQGHPKLQPELLGIYLSRFSKELGIKIQQLSVTYHGRNGKPTQFDGKWSEEAGREIARSVSKGEFGKCAVVDYDGPISSDASGEFFIRMIPLEEAAQKMTLEQYAEKKGLENPMDFENLTVKPVMGQFYPHVFGDRKNPKDYSPKFPAERVRL